MGEYIYIYPYIKDLNVYIGKYSSKTKYDEELENLRKEYNKVIDDEYTKITNTFEESKTKIGEYDAVLFKVKKEILGKKTNNLTNNYTYYWVFKTEDGIVRTFNISSKNEDLVKEYTYIAESYSLIKY